MYKGIILNRWVREGLTKKVAFSVPKTEEEERASNVSGRVSKRMEQHRGQYGWRRMGEMKNRNEVRRGK